MARKPKLDIETTTASATSRKPGSAAQAQGKGDSFVVKHDASRLHWDFRLELDGVLKSWAVPRARRSTPTTSGSRCGPRITRSIMASSKGVIPKGEYGGGTVMLWDRGRWQPEPGKDPSETIEEGHLHFTLDGERMGNG